MCQCTIGNRTFNSVAELEAAVSLFCGPLNKRRGGPLDPLTAEDIAQRERDREWAARKHRESKERRGEHQVATSGTVAIDAVAKAFERVGEIGDMRKRIDDLEKYHASGASTQASWDELQELRARLQARTTVSTPKPDTSNPQALAEWEWKFQRPEGFTSGANYIAWRVAELRGLCHTYKPGTSVKTWTLGQL